MRKGMIGFGAFFPMGILRSFFFKFEIELFEDDPSGGGKIESRRGRKRGFGLSLSEIKSYRL